MPMDELAHCLSVAISKKAAVPLTGNTFYKSDPECLTSTSSSIRRKVDTFAIWLPVPANTCSERPFRISSHFSGECVPGCYRPLMNDFCRCKPMTAFLTYLTGSVLYWQVSIALLFYQVCKHKSSVEWNWKHGIAKCPTPFAVSFTSMFIK